MLTIVSDRWTQFFFDRQWWQKAWSLSMAFAPHCISAAAAMTIANLVVVLGTAFFEHSMAQLQRAQSIDVSQLLLPAMLCMGILVLAVPLSFWALWRWMLRLTAFAKLFTENANPLDKTAIAKEVADAAARRGFIARVWVVASMLLLPPVLPLCLLIGMHTLFFGGGSMKLTIDPAVFSLPAWMLDGRTQLIAGFVGMLLTIVALGYSFVTLAFSAVSPLPAGKTAVFAAKQTLQHFLPLFAVTTIVFMFNIALTAPQLVLGLTPWSALVHHFVAESIAQVWLGVSSTVVWTLSLAPFCQMIQPAEVENNHATA